MSWCGLQGHDAVVEQFRQSLHQRRLASTFLFVGPAGIGKATFARRLAQSLQCERNPETALEPCNVCPSCQQCMADSHPDIQAIVKPSERAFIPIDLFIGPKENRMREGLCHWVSLRPAAGRRRIGIIEDADFLNQEGANCLLKTLEEPPPNSILILVGTSEQRQLPTIRSRCQVVHFRSLDPAFIAEKLLTQSELADAAEAHLLADLAEGSLARALAWSEPAINQFRKELWSRLASRRIDSIALAKWIQQFVDAAGKEAPVRRQRLLRVIELFLFFYREWLQHGETNGSHRLGVHLGTLAYDAESLAFCIERCIEAEHQVAANANLATLIESWVDDLIHRITV